MEHKEEGCRLTVLEWRRLVSLRVVLGGRSLWFLSCTALPRMPLTRALICIIQQLTLGDWIYQVEQYPSLWTKFHDQKPSCALPFQAFRRRVLSV